jgi:hypothetical protein
MKDVEAAIDRLTQAVDRLARAAEARLGQGRKIAAELHREAADKEQLAALTAGASGRLDDMIGRLRSVLQD